MTAGANLYVPSGNVGIGTSSPGRQLTIGDGTGGKYAEVKGGNSGTSGGASLLVTLSSTVSYAYGNKSSILGGAYDNTLLVYNGINSATAFYTNNTEVMRIDSSGKVGIGTSSPANKLSVTSSTQYDGILLSNGTYTVGYMTGNTATNDDGQLTLLSGGVAKVSLLANGNTYFNGGNVGIGTSSPSAGLLDVNGGITNRGGTLSTVGYVTLIRGDASHTGYMEFKNADTTRAGYIGYGSTSALLLWSESATAGLSFGTNNTEAMRINSSGNVGIGVTPYDTGLFLYRSVAGLLYSDIQNPSAANASDGSVQRFITSNVAGSGTTSLDIVKYKSGAASIKNNETNSAAYISFEIASAELMRISSSGNVGIGTSSPSYSLVVSKNQNAATVIQNVNNNTGASAVSILQSKIGASSYVNYSTFANYNQIVGSGITTQYIDFDTQIFRNTAGSEAMRIDSSGNVGIGTSSPGYKLTVAGLAALGTASGVYGNSADMRLETATGRGWRMGTTSTGSTHGYFYIQGSTDNFVSSFIDSLNIDTSGNVGIGTSSPNASAILDAQSTTKGVRFPNMTTTQKNAVSSPAAGLVVFDTTLAKLCVYSGSAWQTITSV